jgi:hypothetical protein
VGFFSRFCFVLENFVDSKFRVSCSCNTVVVLGADSPGKAAQ